MNNSYFIEKAPHVGRLEELRESDGVLSICISFDDGKRAEYFFSRHVFFQKLDEGDAVLTLSEMATVDVLGKSFYTFRHSALLSWFRRESAGIYDGVDLVHHRFCTIDDIIDIISTCHEDGEPFFKELVS